MDVEIRHSPSFAVARIHLGANETINGEAGVMYEQTLNIKVESKMQGGLFGAAKRALLSGDSFFVSQFTAQGQPGWVDLAPPLPGDVFSAEITPGHGLILTKGSWIASDPRVDLDAKFGNSATFFGGEGLFVVKATGTGHVVMAAYGAMDVHSLKQGEGLTIDTGHLVAYEDGMRTKIRKVSSGLLSTFKSGEGLVMDIEGPGDVITQTRNPSAFGSWLSSILGNKGSSGSSSPAGGIIGGLLSN